MPVDLTGKQFGRLTVIGKSDKRSSKGEVIWTCKCSCDDHSIIEARTSSLKSGNTKSCGCLHKEIIRKLKSVDLVGKTFGRLTVIERAPNSETGKGRWVCKCSCGSSARPIVITDHLIGGHTQSCGCLHHEVITKWETPDEHRIVSIFSGMKQRCYNPKDKHYSDYGGRGITICQEWLDDVSKFVDWSLKNGYQSGLSIDRKNDGEFKQNQDGPYAPWNCRWADDKTQANNKRTNVFFTVGDDMRTISQWSRFLDEPRERIRYIHSSQPERLEQLIISNKFYKGLRNGK